MASGIGDLVARLGLDNSGFKKGLSASRSMLSSFAGGIAGIISPIGATFAGIAGTAGMGLLVKSSFEGVDALAKFGQKVGLTADRAAGFQHAAELSGVSTDQLSAAMQRLSRNGLDIFAVADRIAAIEDPAERSAYAFEVLGKSGGELIPMLSGGAASLRQMVAEGAKLSGLEGLDASRIEEANDAISRAKAGFQGIANIAAVTLAPAVEWMAIKMQDFSEFVRSGTAIFPALGAIGTQVANAVSAAWSHIGGVFGSIFSFIGSGGQEAFAAVGRFAFDMFAGVEYVFMHMGDSFAYAWAELKLGSVVAFEELSHLFTVKIPAVLTWFAGNWKDIFFTVLDYTSTVFINLGSNIRSAMQEIWDFITSAGTDSMEFAWKPLEEGFVNTVKKLPDIPERAITELEKELASEAMTLGQSFGDGLAQHIELRRGELLSGTALDPFKLSSELDTSKLAPPSMLDGEFGGQAEMAAKQPAALKAAFAGSQEAASIMLRGIGGKSMEQIATKQLTVQTQTLAAVKANKPATLAPLSLGTA